MKTFNQYLEEDKFKLAALLVEECDFPLISLVEWYFTEGHCLSESELSQVMEGFWAESFWGDTWKSAAKGAGIGAGAGGAAGGLFGNLPGAAGGAGLGGLLGGAAGGLYGMGKHLWHRLRGKKDDPQDKANTALILKKLAADHPELGLNPEELIARLGKPPEGKPPVAPPQPTDYDNVHPAYKRPGVQPFGDHTIQ